MSTSWALGLAAAAAAAVYVAWRKMAPPSGNAKIELTLAPGPMADMTLMPGDVLDLFAPFGGGITSVGGTAFAWSRPSVQVELGTWSIDWTDASGSPQTSSLHVVAGT